MNLNDIKTIFNRSLAYSLQRKKLILISLILALCGVFVVFCRAVSAYAGSWVIMSLAFLPIFICSGVMLSAGIFLTRIYHDEIKGRPFTYSETLAKSWEVIIGASYFAIPLILTYLVMWMFLGIFVILRDIPGVGEVFAVILAFAPFLLNLASLLLGVISLIMLYLLTPIIALRGINRMKISQILVDRLTLDPFSNIMLGFVALFPLVVSLAILIGAGLITGAVCYSCDEPWHHALQWFFMMIPFTALLSPAVVFFFNLSAEAHVLLAKRAVNKT